MKKTVLCVLFCFTPSYLYGFVAGSNTQTTVQSFVEFPQADTNNTMLGFGSFVNGFGLANMNTTCTFNDFFPVGGPIFLNGGTLYLQEDLNVAENAAIWTGGAIDGQRHAISFQQTNSFSFPVYYGTNMLMPLTSGFSRANVVPTIDWSYNDNYIMNSATYIYYIWQFLATTLLSKGSFTNNFASPEMVAWHPSQYFFAFGTYYNTNYNWGVGYFNPATDQFTTVTSIQEGYPYVVFSVAWNSTGSYLLITRNSTPFIKIYSFNSTTSSTAFVSSTVGYEATFNNSLAWNSNGSYFAGVSNITISHGLEIYSFNSSTSTISPVQGVATAVAPTCVDWSATNSYIAVGYNVTATWLQLYQFIPTATLTKVYDYPTTFTGSVYALKWSKDGTHLAVSYSYQGLNQLGLFQFNASGPSLTLITSIVPANYIASLSWSHSGCYLAAGDSLGNSIVYFTCAQPGLTLKNCVTRFNQNVYLQAPLHCQGTMVIDGGGYGLYPGTAGGIVVDSGSSLLLKDITIYNSTATNISCADNTSTISFANVVWCLGSDVTFTQGQLAITGELAMTGSHQFIYQSDQMSTIYDHATWYFDNGMTFSYAPPHGANNLIAFQNNASTLYLYGTTLHAPSTGLRLTKGCVTIEGPCPFLSDGANEANGIWIGDGTPADDLKVKILAESGIIVEKGYASYRNVR